MNDAVNKPKHYTAHPSGVECRDIAAYFPSPMANAIKYMWRYELKENPKQDLEKCLWYLKETLKLPFSLISTQTKIAEQFIDKDKISDYLLYEDNGRRLQFMHYMNEFLHWRNKISIEKAIVTVKLAIKELK